MTKINCFIPFASAEQAQATVDGLKSNPLVNKIFLLAGDEEEVLNRLRLTQGKFFQLAHLLYRKQGAQDFQ